MRKKTLALAIGAALAAPSAFAQTGIEVYGKLYPEIFTSEGKGATAVGTTGLSTLVGTVTGVNNESRSGLNASNSRFGFRGGEDLGGGRKAIYQFETQVNVDDGTAGFWATRDSFVGLNGGFGTVRLGFMDTPLKRVGDTLSFLGVSSGNFVSTSNVLRRSGFGTSSSSASFHLRRPNAVDYETPMLGNVQAAIQWSSGTSGGVEAPITATGPMPSALSTAITYEAGPFYFSIAYEEHKNLFGGSSSLGAALANTAASGATSKDDATQAAVKYRFGEHVIEFDVIQKKYTETPTANGKFQEYKNVAWELVYEGRIAANWRLAAHYVSSGAGSCTLRGAACTTTGLEAHQVSVGAAYDLSRRTSIFGFVAQVTNGASARHNNSTTMTLAPGEDPRSIALGVSHTF